MPISRTKPPQAVAFGAEGIGLCRTEHMFFGHLDEIREMIVADTKESREKALAKLLPFQRDDFAGLFREMKGRPVTIRLLDPPLHEFLSEHHLHEQPELAEKLAKQLGVSAEAIERRVEESQRDEPHAGPPRLPAGDRLSRDHRHAGAGHL